MAGWRIRGATLSLWGVLWGLPPSLPLPPTNRQTPDPRTHRCSEDVIVAVEAGGQPPAVQLLPQHPHHAPRHPQRLMHLTLQPAAVHPHPNTHTPRSAAVHPNTHPHPQIRTHTATRSTHTTSLDPHPHHPGVCSHNTPDPRQRRPQTRTHNTPTRSAPTHRCQRCHRSRSG